MYSSVARCGSSASGERSAFSDRLLPCGHTSRTVRAASGPKNLRGRRRPSDFVLRCSSAASAQPSATCDPFSLRTKSVCRIGLGPVHAPEARASRAGQRFSNLIIQVFVPVLFLFLAPPSPAQVAILHITVVEGDGAVHVPGSRSSRPLTVEITDEIGKPVADAAVTFHLPDDGPGGAFPSGLRTAVVTTDLRGRATLRGFQVNRNPGRFQIRIFASKEQARAGTVSFQYIAEAGSGAAGARVSPAARTDAPPSATASRNAAAPRGSPSRDAARPAESPA